MSSYGKSMFPNDYLAAQEETRMTDKQIPLQKHLNIVSDLKLKLDELRSKWLFPCNTEAADLIERLIRERDEARAKAIDEAAAAFRRVAPGAMLAGDVDRVESHILALKDKP
jgi:hypothetical protein